MKERDSHHHPSEAKRDHAINNLPGAAVDHADDEKVDPAMVKQRTKMQNNNPRTSE